MIRLSSLQAGWRPHQPGERDKLPIRLAAGGLAGGDWRGGGGDGGDGPRAAGTGVRETAALPPARGHIHTSRCSRIQVYDPVNHLVMVQTALLSYQANPYREGT